MLTKGAIGNLVNRYRAVLKKCTLINTFGSLAVASMLVMGGAGVAGAADVTYNGTDVYTLNNANGADKVVLDITRSDNYYGVYLNAGNITVGNLELTSNVGGMVVEGAPVTITANSMTIENGGLAAIYNGDVTGASLTLNVTGDLHTKGWQGIIAGDVPKTTTITAKNITMETDNCGIGSYGNVVLNADNITLTSGEYNNRGAIETWDTKASVKLTATNDINITGAVQGKARNTGRSEISLTANNVTITSAQGAGQEASTDGVIRNVSIDATSKVTLKSTGNLAGIGAGANDETRPHSENRIKAKELEIVSEGSFGVYANDHGNHTAGTKQHCNIDADIINITSKKDGILVMNGAEAAVTGFDTLNITSGEQGIGSEYGDITIDGGNIVVDASEEGIRSKLGGDIDIKAKLLKVDAGEGFESIKLTGDSELIVESDITQLNGDITTEPYEGKNAKLKINFNGSDSYLNGKVTTSEGADTELAFNGGTWNATGDSSVTRLLLDEANVNVYSGTDIVADTVTGNGNINMEDADELGSFSAAAGDAAVNVQATDADGNVKNADEVSAETLKKMKAQVTGLTNVTASAPEGDVEGAISIDKNGNAKQAKNTLMDAALKQASVASISLDRILTNDVRKRMGDLRANANQSGVWMRWDGGKLKGNGLTNDFNTIQIGADTKVAKNCRLGLAGSFTHGDTDFARGNGELESFSFAAYATWMGENGMFADVVARLGHFSTEMNVEGRSGDMDNRVASLSGEYGWRFNVCDQFFVEPQVEVAYTYVSSEDLELGTAQYHFDNVDSLTGRAGLVFGWNLPDDRGNVYARASVLQQFMGDAKISGVNGAAHNVQEIDGDDTWLEYGLGANIKLTDKTYVWADVERTEGAEIEEEWRGTVGVRFSF